MCARDHQDTVYVRRFLRTQSLWTRTFSPEEEHLTSEESPGPTPSRDYRALVILAILAGLEVAILYVVIVLDTPLRPLAHRLLENPAGVFTLVMSVVTVLIVGMIGFLAWMEWAHKRRREDEQPSS